jgi:hypothetical protein
VPQHRHNNGGRQVAVTHQRVNRHGPRPNQFEHLDPAAASSAGERGQTGIPRRRPLAGAAIWGRGRLKQEGSRLLCASRVAPAARGQRQTRWGLVFGLRLQPPITAPKTAIRPAERRVQAGRRGFPARQPTGAEGRVAPTAVVSTHPRSSAAGGWHPGLAASAADGNRSVHPDR